MAQIHQIIRDTASGNKDGISWDEFAVQLETPAMKNLFKALDLDTAEAEDLFRLIDIDHAGEISSEELIYGCFKLRGSARAIHMHAFIFEYLKFAGEMRAHNQCVQETLTWLAGLQQNTFLGSPSLARQFSPPPSLIKGASKLSV